MSKMVTETKTIGYLHQDKEDEEEYETYKLYGETVWQDQKCNVHIEVEHLLYPFIGKQVEITIKVIEES